MVGTKEFSDLMEMFEKTTGKSHRTDHEELEGEYWNRGYFYQNGETNNLFKAFMDGYQLAKSMARQDALPLDA